MRSLNVDDIEGAKANTKLNVDTLWPEYKLPSHNLTPIKAPKFVKNSMNIDDIKGTRSRPQILVKQHDTMNVDVIDGAQAG